MRIYLVVFLFLFSSCSHNQKTEGGGPIKSSTQNRAQIAKPIVEKIYGVTIDTTDHLESTIASLKNLRFKPTVRIVFDQNTSALKYEEAIKKLNQVSFVMGELADSFYMKKYTINEFQQLTLDYLNTFKKEVDIWEIGNEINGEWNGKTSDVVKKINFAFAEVKKRNQKTALTLYYNEDCWENPEAEMFKWAEKNLTTDMKSNLDFVFISYYEDDCNNLQPNWTTVFIKLSAMFPNSKLGFGEVGTKYDNKKAEYLRRYYGMKIDVPNFVGGYFWWYFYQDMVPLSKPMWEVFNSSLKD
jgi:hypothetical protein